MRGFALEGFGGCVLETEFFDALRFEFREVPGIAHDRAVFDRPDRLDRAVEKLTVVRDDENGRFDVAKPVFEPDQTVDVEVVRRFVEEQKVGRTHQRSGKRHAVSPAAREVVDEARRVGIAKAETRENRSRLRFDRAFIQFGEFRVRGGKCQFVRGVFEFGEALFGRDERRVARENKVEDRHVFRHEGLRDVGDALEGRAFDVAPLRREFSEDGRKERGFAAAVRADKSDAFAGRRRERGVFIEHARAAREGKVQQSEHGKNSKRPRRLGARP